MDDQMAIVEEVQNRSDWIKELAGLDRIDALDATQKEKVKWDIEGDENTPFFHGLLKQRRRLQMVQGIMHDGEWCTDPEQVKRTFLEFYHDKFTAGQFVTPNLPQSRCNHLSAEEIKELERPVTIDEIKYVVWQCGSDESLALVKVRQILDGPLMVSEVMEWYKLKRKKLMIFKVDFKKAYESLCWEYLDYVMERFGFGHKWRSWIRECLVSPRMSVLVNESPTNEFDLHRGLHQGDLLSHFLFIIAMEGLHLAIEKAIEDNKISGASVSVDIVKVSHLLYADDVVFLTKWIARDVDEILDVLNEFYNSSSLKINVGKSNMYGVGVSLDEITNMAAST
ncbi:RNA-directed DNA polymerase, eukaryota, reverse transcriptase zinc-binding domain protein [Tanacetum coccineum]